MTRVGYGRPELICNYVDLIEICWFNSITHQRMHSLMVIEPYCDSEYVVSVSPANVVNECHKTDDEEVNSFV